MKMPVRWSLENDICDAYEVKGARSSDIHGHHHFLLILITRGRGVQILNGRHIEFSPGDMFLLSPADFHENKLQDGESFDYFGVKFHIDVCDKSFSDLCSARKLPLTVHLSDEKYKVAEDIFSRLVKESESRDGLVGRAVYLKTMIEQLVIIVLRELPKEERTAVSGFANRALGYLYSHFFERITVEDAAEYMGYTTNYFNSRFKSTVGRPFGEYLRDMRLSFAAKLLSSSDMSVTEVAEESGFETLAHFSRSFRERYGISPKDYKYERRAEDNQ